jgi:predicted metal-dependent peptidase
MDTTKHERRLKKIKIGLMRNPKFAFWGSIMMIGKTSVSVTCPSAYTNGRDEVYGTKFMDELDDKELSFVVLHENMHKAYRHMFTWRKLWDIDKQLANAACDYVINIQLKDLDPKEQYIAMPMKDGKVYGLLDEKYRGMNAKQVFDLLQQKQKEGGGGAGGGGGDGEPNNVSGGFDDHDWEGAQELSDEEKKHLEREIDQAVRSGAMSDAIGVGGGNTPRDLAELLEPKVDWREQLREFVRAVCANKDSSSWRRPNRRFLSTGIYMPSMVGEKIGHIVIARDTSGSMGSDELSSAATETKAIADEVSPERVDMIDWDGVVESHQQFEGNNVSPVDVQNMRGGGGTDPRCVAKYLKEQGIKPECVVILTDGYIDQWGDDELWQNVPVLWAIVGGNNVMSPQGKTIHVEM